MSGESSTKKAPGLKDCRKAARQALELVGGSVRGWFIRKFLESRAIEECRSDLKAADLARDSGTPAAAVALWRKSLERCQVLANRASGHGLGYIVFRDRHRQKLRDCVKRFEQSEKKFLAYAKKSGSSTKGKAKSSKPPALFDAAWYLAQNPDIAAAGVDPWKHFSQQGWREKRAPHPLFDLKWYAERYADVAQSGMNPLAHYLQFGAAESRDPHPLFDVPWYRKKYADDLAGVSEPLSYYLEQGWRKGHTPYPYFDPQRYLEAHPELKEQGREPLTHFVTEGWRDRRGCDPRLVYPVLPGFFQDQIDYDKFFEEREKRLHPKRPNCGSRPRTVISVTVVLNNESPFLESALQSVLTQTHYDWKLIAIDLSVRLPQAKMLRSLALEDARVHVVDVIDDAVTPLKTLVATAGEWVGILPPHCELAPDALERIARFLEEHPNTDFVYTDEDKIDEAGRFHDPFYKPDWSPVYQLGFAYLGDFVVHRSTYLLRQDWKGLPGMGWFALKEERVRHVPGVLHHEHVGGCLPKTPSPRVVYEAGELQKIGFTTVVPHVSEKHPEVVHLLPAPDMPRPMVSIIIPCLENSAYVTRCLASILTPSAYENLEILLVVKKGPRTCDTIEKALLHPKVRLVEYEFPFSYSLVNNLGAEHAKGELLLFLNDDTEVLTPDWLGIMVAHLSLPNVGAVGPKLLYPDRTIQHAGLVLGVSGTVDHLLRGAPDGAGYFGSLAVSHEVSAVTGACVMMCAETYQKVGGMSDAYASIYQDVDLCLKVRELGLTVLYVANVELTHFESVSRGSEFNHIDRAVFVDRWCEQLAHDPYYNANFSRNRHDYSLKKAAAA